MPPTRKTLTKSTTEAAKSLLGAKLTTTLNGRRTSGMIVEVEAYCGAMDEAAHSFRGPTPRCEVMFDRPGLCYVYFTYGMHFCVNVVTREKGIGEAVLIRAIEPLEGLETMKRRRPSTKLTDLTNGPAKLCKALAIDRSFLGEDLFTSERIRITPHRNILPKEIATSKRIGITRSTHLPLRFYVRESPFISRSRAVLTS